MELREADQNLKEMLAHRAALGEQIRELRRHQEQLAEARERLEAEHATIDARIEALEAPNADRQLTETLRLHREQQKRNIVGDRDLRVAGQARLNQMIDAKA